MKTAFGHLGYCTNIHSGESWQEHFTNLKLHVPAIKKVISPDHPFGIGLRIADEASRALLHKDSLRAFRQWLQQEDCYVFTVNGFPYGGFHHIRVKENVHAPDWTTKERVDYTIRLSMILAALLPEGMDGGISTSPISYRYWHAESQKREEALQKGTRHLLQVLHYLIGLKRESGRSIHIDIEPEPGGLIETGAEFLQWYEAVLLPVGIKYLWSELQLPEEEALAAIQEHLQLCLDICHFSVGFEDVASALEQLSAKGIRVGKIQVSAALKGVLPTSPEKRHEVITAFCPFNEPTYLHQVVALQADGALKYYADLPEALLPNASSDAKEWRAHFHVPLFVADYGVLQSTQLEVETLLARQREHPFTQHLEVETYTWDVLPADLKLPLTESIVRELEWVKALLSEERPVPGP